MRIISPFRDYYDTAQGFGADQTRLFLRKPENIAVNKLMVPHELASVCANVRTWGDTRWSASLVPIVFCGKLYHALRLRTSNYSMQAYNVSEALCYTLASAQNWAKDKGTDEMRAFISRRIKKGDLPLDNQGTTLSIPWLIENNAPILVCDNQNYEGFLVKNAKLAELQFFKQFDPVQAYQELDMYLSGILAAENKPMVQISDKIRAQQHGFDCYSFRQAPSKRKAKQCTDGKG
jgi:hypothetical protein